MFIKTYVIRLAFLLSIVQLALAVYLGIQAINEVEFYDKMFYYSLFTSFIPIVFGIIIFSFSGETNTVEEHSNGFVSKNNIEKHKFGQLDTSLYLFLLGFIFIAFNLIFRLFFLPNWINVILPVLLGFVILNNKEKQLFLEEN